MEINSVENGAVSQFVSNLDMEPAHKCSGSGRSGINWSREPDPDPFYFIIRFKEFFF